MADTTPKTEDAAPKTEPPPTTEEPAAKPKSLEMEEPITKAEPIGKMEDPAVETEPVPKTGDAAPKAESTHKTEEPTNPAPPTTEEPTIPAPVPAQKPEPTPALHQPEVVSDPSEDDLSDLDDVLDEFASTHLNSKSKIPSSSTSKSVPPTSGPARPDPADLLAAGDDDEFAKQLQAEMESLLGQKDFAKRFDEILQEMNETDPSILGGGGGGGSSSDDPKKPSAASSAPKPDEAFQDTIRRTMERMQESGDQAGAAAQSADENDFLAQMLKELEGGGFGGEDNDEDFSKVLMGMMEQLTNKEILYEPMKELDTKFPGWMEKNRDKTGKEDLERYEEQRSLVREIVERFERQGYSDQNSADREYIVERMQKMQAAGSPPPDLVGDMNAAQEALGEIDQGCPTQ